MPNAQAPVKRTVAEWDRLYAKAADPTQKQMTEKEYRRYRYEQLVKGRFKNARNMLFSAFQGAPQQKGKKKQADEMAQRFNYITNQFQRR